jgi:hypothetical protein
MVAGLIFIACDNGDDEVVITFDANHAQANLEGDAEITIKKNGTIAEADAPKAVWGDRVISGWNTANDGTGTALVFGTTAHADNTTYYAIWDVVAVTFDAGEGAFETAGNPKTRVLSNLAKGATVAIPTDVTRSGWELVEWNTNKDDPDAGTKLETTTTHAANTTYHAIWSFGKVIYCLSTDLDIASFGGTGGRRNTGEGAHFMQATGAAETLITVNEDNTLTQTLRTGSSQGIRLNLSMLNDITKPLHSYRLEYGGILHNSGDASAGGPNRGRFRLEGGNNPSSSSPIGIPEATSNVLLFSEQLNAEIGDDTEEFLMVWTVTAEELEALTSGSGTTISYGDERHNDQRLWDITYTVVRITEFIPEE